MTLQSKRKTSGLRRLILTLILLTIASVGASAQTPTNTFPDNGSAGVGTTSPVTDLEVKNSSHAGVAVNSGVNSTDASIVFQRGGVNKWFLQSRNSGAPTDSFVIYDAVNYTFPFVLTRSGNVGLGTTTPGQKLNVIGNGLFGDLTSRTLIYSSYDAQQNPFLEVGYGTSHSAITPFPAFVLSNHTTSTSNAEGLIGQIVFANRSIADNNDKRTAVITSWVDGASNSGTLQFYTSSAGTVAERLRITPAGNVGIGTTPGALYRLDVQGKINSSELCIATDCKSSWSQVGGGGGSTSFSNITAGTNTLALLVGSGGSLGTSGSGTINATTLGGATFAAPGAIGATTPGTGAFSAVGINTAPSSYKLDVTGNTNVTGNINVAGTGNITAVGTIEGGNIKAKYQDLAEWVPSSEQLAAGTVVVLDTTKSNQVISSGTAYDTRVAGVISAQPGITLGESGEGKVLVATTGRVRVKVDASRGAIQIGDLLVTSDVSGVAMKSEPVEFAGRKMHMPGTIIGKALEPLAKGSGEILVLLSLQ